MIIFLLLSACGKKNSNEPVCTEYPGAYQIHYPDNTDKKSSVSVCDGHYKATSLVDGQTLDGQLVVLLRDKFGTPYYTNFAGQ